jgi:hypothetical protein
MRLNAIDADFLARFESGQIDPASFTHEQHLRLAWCCLQADAASAPQRICTLIRDFAIRAGAAGKYHETLTLAWLRIVDAHRAGEPDFDAYLRAHPQLLDRLLCSRHYSAEQMENGRAKWVEPDLQAFPEPSFK